MVSMTDREFFKMHFEGKWTFSKLGKYQELILDAISKALPGAAPDYAALPNGNVALIVIFTGFENRSEADREQLVRNSIIGSLQINPDDYISGFKCWTPREEAEIKKAGESSSGQA
jgi:hypothetical protein